MAFISAKLSGIINSFYPLISLDNRENCCEKICNKSNLREEGLTFGSLYRPSHGREIIAAGM